MLCIAPLYDHELIDVFFSHLCRSPEMSVALERIFPQNRKTKDCTLFPGVTLNYMIFYDCVHLLQRVKAIVEQNRPVYRCQIQPFLLHFRSKTSCLLLTIEVSAIVMLTVIICIRLHLKLNLNFNLEQCTQ